MPDTPASLLERLRSHADAGAWQRLVNLYTPLLHGWLNRHGLQACDADDLVQDVLAVVVREVPHFQHNRRPGAFRCWLRTVLVHRLRAFWKAGRARPAATGGSDVARLLGQMEDPGSGLS